MSKLSASVERCFSRAALVYQELAGLQLLLARELMQHVSRAGGRPSRILELGCGTGFLTRELLSSFPEANVHAVDFSGAMLESARAYCEQNPRVVWLKQDGRGPFQENTYDLAVSSSALQWMEPLPLTFLHISRALTGTGRLFFLAMLSDTFIELRNLREALFPETQPASRFRTREEICEILRGSSLHVLSAEERRHREEHASADDFFRAIHAQGFTGGPVSHGRRLLTRGELRCLGQAYGEQFSVCRHGAIAGVYATNHYGIFGAAV